LGGLEREVQALLSDPWTYVWLEAKRSPNP
jgi:hypothetical protein